MAKPRSHRRKGPFRSRAQWRWAFATHKRFAHRWAREIVATRGPRVGYHSLPYKVSATSAAGIRAAFARR